MKNTVLTILFLVLIITLFAQEKDPKIHYLTIKDDGSVEHQDGMRQYENGDFEQAFVLFEKSAQKENGSGMFMLGSMYSNGKGVEQSYSKAMEWYLKASDKKHEVAMFNIAVFYMSGQGVAKNEVLAMEWAEKAANHGHVRSMLNLASEAYEKKDNTKLFFWMNKAAATGHAEAMNNLAMLYEKGVGTPVNQNKAMEWHTKAAQEGVIPSITYIAWKAYDVGDYKTALNWFLKGVEAGDTRSMTIAAMLYSDGTGTERNVNKAYALWLKAAELNEPSAIYNIGKLYEDGLITNGTKQQAIEWYKRAAALQDEDAIKRLKYLGY